MSTSGFNLEDAEMFDASGFVLAAALGLLPWPVWQYHAAWMLPDGL
jgi:hypothetical protein